MMQGKNGKKREVCSHLFVSHDDAMCFSFEIQCESLLRNVQLHATSTTSADSIDYYLISSNVCPDKLSNYTYIIYVCLSRVYFSFYE